MGRQNHNSRVEPETPGVDLATSNFPASRHTVSCIEVDHSVYQHLTLSTVARLMQTAEKHSDALRYFPEGSKLLLTADGDRGSAWESGYLVLYCQLKYPSANEKFRLSGNERVNPRGGDVVDGFEFFLMKLKGESPR